MSQYLFESKIHLFETFCRRTQVDGKVISAEICKLPLKLKVASTPKSQSTGYMNSQDEPGENEGILFIYDTEQILGFWMKNVNFPLDIIFFDSKMQYVGHQSMKSFDGEKDENLPIYTSKKPARFAVELKAGWCEDKDFKDSHLKI